MVIHVLKESAQPLHGAEYKKHPERVEDHQKNDDGDVDGLAGQDMFRYRGCLGSLKIGVNDIEHVHKPKEEDNQQDRLEKHEIEMAHEPFGGEVVEVPDF